MDWIDLDQAVSTNDEVRLLVREGCALPVLVRAAEQTGGRGRLGRVWSSPRGGVWMSIGWRTKMTLELTGDLGLVVGLSVWRGIVGVEPGVEDRLRIKRPNDLLLDGKKLCGILCEREGELLVVGIGINADFDSSELPAELRETATTLRDALGRGVDADALAERVVAETVALLAEVERGGMSKALHDAIRERE